MNIQEIYNQYQIPPNLQRHMREVAAVGLCLADHWHGPDLDQPLLLHGALLHDMGNILKFQRPFLGELEPQQQYWITVQDSFHQRFGPDVHQATLAILRELQLPEQVTQLLNQMKQLADGQPGEYAWEVRILQYADCVVTPEGIVGFERRMHDLQQRYQKHLQGPGWDQHLRENVRLLQTQTSVELFTLGERECAPYMAHVQIVQMKVEK